ncbi:MAG TPA: hypothetical protein VMW24_10955 [Sedimentisphaerales bacterium]|nr:hypothetical protein [Sedimentisphaerales bacterium]
MADLSGFSMAQLRNAARNKAAQVSALNADRREIFAEIEKRQSRVKAQIWLDRMTPEEIDAMHDLIEEMP